MDNHIDSKRLVEPRKRQDIRELRGTVAIRPEYDHKRLRIARVNKPGTPYSEAGRR